MQICTHIHTEFNSQANLLEMQYILEQFLVKKTINQNVTHDSQFFHYISITLLKKMREAVTQKCDVPEVND